MHERRRFPRVPFQRGVLWRSPRSLDNLDNSRNISEGGVCIAIKNEDLKINDTIQLEFTLPTKKVINAKGMVRWIAPFGEDGICAAGLAFSDLASASQQEMRHFVGVCRYGCE